MMMIYDNMSKLNDEHFSLIERLYGISKEKILKIPEVELADLFFPEGDSPLWDAMLDFDDNYNPLPDTLLAEQICDILRPSDIFNPQNDYPDEDAEIDVA